MNEATEVMKVVAQATNSDLVHIVVIFATVFIASALVLATLVIHSLNVNNKVNREASERSEKREERSEKREERLINVIYENTDAIASLKATIDSFSIITNQSFSKIDDQLNKISNDNEAIKDDIDEIKFVIKSNSKEE